jgi:CobW/HypB/UreG, nucleotide-binding domain
MLGPDGVAPGECSCTGNVTAGLGWPSGDAAPARESDLRKVRRRGRLLPFGLPIASLSLIYKGYMTEGEAQREGRRPLLAFVGGFLGAGKTTLILKAAELLKARGYRPAMIFNDQDSGLVDTRRAQAEQWTASEVSGGCFCCKLSDLMEAADELIAYRPDVILAEPVGSCVDLSATILHPLRDMHGGRYRLAPLSVLMDPQMAARVAKHEVAPAIRYLFEQQLAEADLTCLTKSDLARTDRGLSNRCLGYPIDFELSAKSGQGVVAWLNEVLASTRVVGARLLAVDYQQYGAAEAELGWVNLHADVELEHAASPLAVCGPLLEAMEEGLKADAIEIAHLKVFDRAGAGWVTASICSGGHAPIPSGDLLAEAGRNHELAINLRAVADPSDLQGVVERSLRDLLGAVRVRHLAAFRPAQPKPQYRFSHEGA